MPDTFAKVETSKVHDKPFFNLACGWPASCGVPALAGCVLKARDNGLQKMWQGWASSRSSCQTLLAALQSTCEGTTWCLTGSLAPQFPGFVFGKMVHVTWCLYVRIWGNMVMVLIWLCFLNQGLSGPQPCCLVYGLMASHWIYDLQPTGPHPAPYPGNGLGGNLSWWRGWWLAGPAMGSGVSEIWRMWIDTDWNRWLPRIDLMGRYFTIPPLWGRSFLFAAKLQELLPTG